MTPPLLLHIDKATLVSLAPVQLHMMMRMMLRMKRSLMMSDHGFSQPFLLFGVLMPKGEISGDLHLHCIFHISLLICIELVFK